MNSIAVIKTRLPYVDRRALSEAWFSALHLARDRAPLPFRHAARAISPQPPERGALPHRHAARAISPQPPERGAKGVRNDWISARGGATGRSRSCESPPEHVMCKRRREAVELCHGWQSEGVVETDPSRREALMQRFKSFRAAFGVTLPGGGRVQILLRREGRILHVVALCSLRHVELVRRALACADLHLRARGEVVRSQVRAL
jgi:hypothetical protein